MGAFRFRFNLRFLLILVLIAAGFSYWLGVCVQRARRLDTLLDQLGNAQRLSSWTERRGDEHFESVLHQLIQFGGNDTARALEDRLQIASSKVPAAEQMLDDIENGKIPKSEDDYAIQYQKVEQLKRNLEVMTALRRIQGKPDPLKIHVHVPVEPVRLSDDIMLSVSIENVDAEKQPVYFTHGGNYRSGRQARWRIQVWNEAGMQLLPQRERVSFIGGGLQSNHNLKFGESWVTELDLDSYVDITEPGKYSVQLLYHNELTIVDMDHVDDLIVAKSQPFELVVVADRR